VKLFYLEWSVSFSLVVRSRAGAGKSLFAFVVPRENSVLAVGALRDWLAGKLPESMIPERFLTLSALPLTPSGKVDRMALESLDGTELPMDSNHVSARNDLEARLVGIWEATLQRNGSGVNDDFLDLGGHSLMALSICARISRDLKVEVPLRWIFEGRTISSLAERIEKAGLQTDELLRMTRASREESLPMSFAQQRMWLIDQTQADPTIFNEPIAHRLMGRVDRQRIEHCLNALMARHEILRTALVNDGEDWLQKIAESGSISLGWSEGDLESLPPAQRIEAAQEWILAEVRRPFDLAVAPLWRGVWIRMAEDDHFGKYWARCVRWFYQASIMWICLLSKWWNWCLEPGRWDKCLCFRRSSFCWKRFLRLCGWAMLRADISRRSVR
jgi:Condensation domain/Phosphopantetheine attachment site/AMP-binding enzyme C-terminal domain